MMLKFAIGPLLVLLAAAMFGAIARADDPRAALDYFEREVRPILVDACQKCHGADKQESDLRLDSREALLKGGVSGPAIVPGEPDKSLLIAAIRHAGDIQMPPQGQADRGADRRGHALGQARRALAGSDSAADSPIQRRRADALGLSAGARSAGAGGRGQRLAESDRRLHPREARGRSVCAVAARRSPHAHSPRHVRPHRPAADAGGSRRRSSATPIRDAYEKLVDRLLASPHYGEHWGRHWLDVARYSDTKGYVYAREERFWVHAWVYRDWVVRALNDDLPYDRFLLLQIAADQAAPDDQAALAAMGFLTLGRRFLGVHARHHRRPHRRRHARHDGPDRRLRPLPRPQVRSDSDRATTTRSTASSKAASERMLPDRRAGRRATRRIRSTRRSWPSAAKKLADGMAARRLETADRNRARVGDYLAAQLELHKYPEEGFDQILGQDRPACRLSSAAGRPIWPTPSSAAIRSSPPGMPMPAIPAARVRRQGGRGHAAARGATGRRGESARGARSSRPPPASMAEVADALRRAVRRRSSASGRS